MELKWIGELSFLGFLRDIQLKGFGWVYLSWQTVTFLSGLHISCLIFNDNIWKFGYYIQYVTLLCLLQYRLRHLLSKFIPIMLCVNFCVCVHISEFVIGHTVKKVWLPCILKVWPRFVSINLQFSRNNKLIWFGTLVYVACLKLSKCKWTRLKTFRLPNIGQNCWAKLLGIGINGYSISLHSVGISKRSTNFMKFTANSANTEKNQKSYFYNLYYVTCNVFCIFWVL